MKHVLFLAPNFNYAKTVITNLSDDMKKHGIDYTAVGTDKKPAFITKEVEVYFIIDDPAKWRFDATRFDEVFGKKELLDTFVELNPFRVVNYPKKTSLSKYIINQNTTPEKGDGYEHYRGGTPNGLYIPDIKKVHFNYPHTIVLWADGTKTIVKCQEGDMYDNQVGLAMAISKKALGNEGNYFNVFKKHLPEVD